MFWSGLPRFWRNLLATVLVAAPFLAVLALLDRLDLTLALVPVAAAGVATLVTSHSDRAEFAACGRWIASLGSAGETRASVELGEDAAAHIARPVIELQRRRRRAERREQDGRMMLERLKAALPDPVILVDDGNVIVDANDAARHAFDIAGGEVPLTRIFRDPGLLRAVATVREKRQPAELAFTPASLPDRRYAAHLEPLAVEGGRRGVLLLLREDSELVMIERMRSDFIANVSHELRTPLSSIVGFIETLQGPARDDAEARAAFLGIMTSEAARMQRLVDDLLSLSRIELASHRPPEETCDPAEIVGHMLDRMRPFAEVSGAVLECDLDPELPKILADSVQLDHALSNLVENAIKYGAEGGVVRIVAIFHHSASDEAISLAGSPAVELAVIDRGPGIAAEHVPRLTERFYRVDKARSRSIGGTGLGLAIVKHIVRRHQGHLHIESRPGEGSRFSIFLPARDGH